MSLSFDWNRVTTDDFSIAIQIIGSRARDPDLVIAPDGFPYLYRWHIVRTPQACIYFHIQIASDPERPLHDHPWDNTSVILAGGYDEIVRQHPKYGDEALEIGRSLRKGATQWRPAEEAHRLILPTHIPYTMTLFSTGPKLREWGFWYPDGWRHYQKVTELHNGVSTHVKEPTNAR